MPRPIPALHMTAPVRPTRIFRCCTLKPDGFVEVDEKEGRGKLSIYPNPASEKIQITLPGKLQHLERLRFYDLSGRQVLEVHSPVAGQTVDVSALPAGMYLLEGQTPDGVFTGKVVVK